VADPTWTIAGMVIFFATLILIRWGSYTYKRREDARRESERVTLGEELRTGIEQRNPALRITSVVQKDHIVIVISSPDEAEASFSSIVVDTHVTERPILVRLRENQGPRFLPPARQEYAPHEAARVINDVTEHFRA
jgi:hypothetical protein